MQNLLNTLYITVPDAYLHLENDTVRVDIDHEKKLQVPLHHLSGIVCFGHTLVSPILMHRLAEDGKSLVMLDATGRFKARLEGAVSGNILLRQAQFRLADDPHRTLDIARACIAGKLKNSRHVLMRGARDAKDTGEQEELTRAAKNLAASLRGLANVTSLDQLRGIEGEAAAQYFKCFNLLIRADHRVDFNFDGRTRRPPRDRVNALLSFLYSVLMNDCRSALEIVGLDPQLGYLHVVRPGRAALALDLMEEFRALVADRLALTLINRGQLRANDFVEREGGAVSLKDDARRAVIVAYQERKQESFAHPLLTNNVALGMLPVLQARLLARAIRGELDGYLPYLVK
ncbi:CRISPR-associated protein Cas1 [Oxalobacteraceae bacterium IMCC9480]|nr:CRISPR-associated protein Cas1 [Oxalobacteraceae bacterium IMCC9480]NDP59247.1 type I-C CRISPR-associated endonuclease Cas1 [Oxalobacteraceae bacterium]